MNEDLHALFRTSIDRLPVGPPPSRAAMAARRRRQLLVRSAFAVPAVVVLAVGGGLLAAGGLGPVSDRGVDPANMDPALSSAQGASAGSDHVASPPERMPSCDGGGMALEFVDWPTRSAATALQAVEQLLGMPLPDADADEVSATRTDIVVPADDGHHVRAIVTVSLGDDGRWRPMSVYSCPTDNLRFAE